MPDNEVERIIFDSLDENEIREFLYNYTQTPHLAGTGTDLVDYTESKFKEYGLDTEIVSYYTYLNYPLDHAVKLVDPVNGTIVFEASLEEDVLEEDKTSGSPDRIPSFHGYSASGNVTAKYIFANYGRREDFDALVAKGVEIKGKIVIVRYGGLFRGLKVKFAQELGAIGVLIYSDPTDDGGVDFSNGYEAYPNGPARNPSSIQRGSVQFLSYAPGDPTTPGYPSHKDSERKDPSHAIPSIPSLPISYKDALPILKALNGKGPKASDFGADWKGILTLKGVDYNIGPSELDLNLYSLQNYSTPAIYDVIGTFEGILKDEVIVVGNHRDSWIVGGAGDPNSGSAVLLGFAKALGELKKKGWRPLRTIKLASWDGEEYGLLGSTEWGEDHAKYLSKKSVAYINLDVAVSGTRFSAGASPSLNHLIRNVTKRVPHPQHDDKSVFDVWESANGAHINTLGTGSDYTVFIDHLGIPSLDFGFSPGPGDPVYHYHSNYDSFDWIDNYVNDTWAFHKAATQLLSLYSVTLSQKPVLQIFVEEYATSLSNSLEQILGKFEKTLELTEFNSEHDSSDRNRNRDHGHDNSNNGNNHNHNNDRDRERDGKTPKTPKQAISQLKKALKEFKKVGKETDEYSEYLLDQYSTDYPWFKFHKKFNLLVKIHIHNYRLKTLERVFLHDEGLDDRPWFKHIFYAPNRYLGYGGTAFPGILESLEDKKPYNLLKWALISKGAINAATGVLS